ncbi:FUSC family protein [Arthrobacter sp. Br18]|uniref:FUSC family protein n=1 Tax=Arthrobacter sp. Br18 TaxID=1312954 RepID=UPI000686E3A9|nr:FUSC family protein [Arthrobacter sp. Br18]
MAAHHSSSPQGGSATVRPGRRSKLPEVRQYLRHPHLLLSFKAALAAGIAWVVAVSMPGVAAEYPYYAPLGALLAIYPTVAGTVKLGLQTMAGLTIGIMLAFFAAWIGDPNSLTIAFVVGSGVLLAGWLKRTAGGGTGIASAGLFVLVIGNNDLSYSLGYLIQMVVGVLIGLTVSALVVPPLHLNEAVAKLAVLRTTAAQQMADIGNALRENWATDDPRWDQRKADLARTAEGAWAALRYAQESRRGNVRRRFHPRDLAKDFEQIEVLEVVTFHTINITNMLQDSIHGTAREPALSPAFREPLQKAFAAVSDVLEQWTVNEIAHDTLRGAQQAMLRVAREMNRSAAKEAPFGAAASIAMSLHRILAAVTPPPPEGTPAYGSLAEHDAKNLPEVSAGESPEPRP